MKLRITRPVQGNIDGIHLDGFAMGAVYEFGTTLGCYLLAEGVAEPVPDDTEAVSSRQTQFIVVQDSTKGPMRPPGWAQPRDQAADRKRSRD